jgi:hypothetical protein
MKRSKKIKLVLITAALAACNRTLVPPASKTVYPEDTTLTATPAERDSTCDPCSQAIISSIWNYSFSNKWPFSFEQISYSPYYPEKLYRKGAVWKNNHFIVRGGFGKSWLQSVSS